MSQLIACAWKHGLVLAADRRVVLEREDGRQVHSVRKLYPLGGRAALATSGAAVGIGLSRAVSRALRRRLVPALDELEAYVLSVFQREYDAFIQQGARWFARHPEAHRRSYVLIGGRTEKGGFRFSFYASEEHGQPYQRLRTLSALTAPRRLGLETRLARAAARGADPDDVARMVVKGLKQVAARDPAVAGPFDVAVFSHSGARFQTFGP